MKTAHSPRVPLVVTLLALLASSTCWAQADRGADALSYVPRDAVLVVNTRPSRILKAETLLPFRAAVEESERTGLFKYLPGPGELDAFQAILLLGRQQPQALTKFTFHEAGDLEKYLDTLGAVEGTVAYTSGRYRIYARGQIVFPIDSRTILVGQEESAIRRCLLAKKEGANDANWAEQWKTVADKDMSFVINTSLLRGIGVGGLIDIVENFDGPGEAFDQVYQLAPLWQRSRHVTGYLSISDRIEIHATGNSVNEDEAKYVHASFVTAISLIRMGLSMANEEFADPKTDTPPELVQSLGLIDQVLERAEVTRDVEQVKLRLTTPPRTTKRVASMLAPLAQATQVRAGRNRSKNNLRQLAIAFHNYHDTYKTFPAAVQIGPKDTPRSWRVTILPFMEHGALYDEYRQDEPWDSPHNSKLLDRMPQVFRSPLDHPGSTSTSYFTIVGPGTIYGKQLRNPRFANITDGTSNTLMLVESKKAVPWTKPQDIEYDGDKPLPQFGGWYPGRFCVALCDGSVRLLPANWDQQMLRAAITPNDGRIVEFPGDD